MKKLMTGIKAIIIVLGSGAFNFPALAAHPEPKDEAGKFNEVVADLLEHLERKEQLLNLLKNVNVSVEAYRVIAADLEKRLPAGHKLPKVSLRDGEVRVEGKPTGMRIQSHSPLKISFRSRIWTYNPDKVTDENYLSLIRFLEKPNSKVSIIDLLLPRARAQDWGAIAMALSIGVAAAAVAVIAVSARGLTQPYPVQPSAVWYAPPPMTVAPYYGVPIAPYPMYPVYPTNPIPYYR